MALASFYKHYYRFFVLLVGLFFLSGNSLCMQDDKKTSIKSNYCKNMRRERTKEIQNNPQIDNHYSIHLLADSNCFSAHENLYFAAIKEAQNQLGVPSPWYNEQKKAAKKQAETFCMEQHKKNDNLQKIEICKQNKYTETINKLDSKKVKDIIKYLDDRENLAKKLFLACSQSINKKISLLPQDIKLPIAWHLPTNRSITNMVFDENKENNDWLMSLQKRSYKDDLQEILKQDCPGEMVYWVSDNIDIDIINLYKRH